MYYAEMYFLAIKIFTIIRNVLIVLLDVIDKLTNITVIITIRMIHMDYPMVFDHVNHCIHTGFFRHNFIQSVPLTHDVHC